MHSKFMHRAVELALRGYGLTSPNPMVGAVIVKGSRVIAEGYHKAAGRPHAEIDALRKAGKKAKGSTLYVNLEPCCHFGRTPPCVDAIIMARVAHVVYGMKDPNPLVAGKGIKKLRKAGIRITGPVLEDVCRRINEPFIKWVTTGIPFVTAKIALTIDGKTADFRGDSKWISNEISRTYVHRLRSGSDIVMVAAGTARKDRPKLNVRLPGYRGRQPIPLIVRNKNGKRANLKTLLRDLGKAGFQSILVEGGGRLHTELLKQSLIDRLIIFIAPKILGSHAKGWIRDIGKRRITEALNIRVERSFALGNDIVIEGKPLY